MATTQVPPQKEIIQMLEKLAGRGEKLDLTRSYRGLNIRQGAIITGFKDDKILLKVRIDRAYTCPDGPIYIHDKRIAHSVRGSFHLNNFNSGIAELSDLNWVWQKWKNRAEDRVQPLKTTFVELDYDGTECKGVLENISTTGMAVLINKSLDPSIELSAEKKVLLSFTLSPDCIFKTLIGSIIYNAMTGSNLIRLGIKFIPYFEEIGCLSTYISARKAEIFAELGQNYRDSETRSQVTNLYF
jgi:hypothetical protein